MTVTLGHLFILVALIDLVVIWSMTSKMLLDERLTEDKRRAALIVRGAGIAVSLGFVAFALLHPLGRLVIA